jgi:hypothetical protein
MDECIAINLDLSLQTIPQWHNQEAKNKMLCQRRPTAGMSRLFRNLHTSRQLANRPDRVDPRHPSRPPNHLSGLHRSFPTCRY